MRVIGVVDLKDGRAVHARAGRRDAYQPVRSRLAPRPGDALALARAYREALSLCEIYVADLDAITGGAPQRTLVRALAGLGRVAVDAGISSAEQARRLVRDGAARVVVGLETLASFDDLEGVVRAVAAECVIFSLDLHGGRPVVRAGAARRAAPLGLVESAGLAGARSVIVLDLARVGTGRGLDLALIGSIRRGFPGLELIAGGGVRGRGDLEHLRDAGCDAALVATALHDGHLTAVDVEAVRGS